MLLIDDRVDGDDRLAGLAVADDQLALTTHDGSQRVTGFDARLQRLAHPLAGRYARPRTPLGDSIISPAMMFDRPWTRAMPSPTSKTVPTSRTSIALSYFSISA